MTIYKTVFTRNRLIAVICYVRTLPLKVEFGQWDTFHKADTKMYCQL